MASKPTKIVATIAPSKHERFKVQSVHRSELRGAPYNPRKITSSARARLKAELARVGLVEPLVWNRTTGNLLSGHQRIAILDELEGGNDYALDVAVVDVEARKEKALNVFFNNPSSQGEFDGEALEKLVRDLGGDLVGTGYVAEDLSFLVNELESAGAENAGSGADNGERDSDTLANQVVVYFEGSAHVAEFLRSIGKTPGERYVKGEEAAKALGIVL